MKKSISFILALCMVISLYGITINAADVTIETEDGSASTNVKATYGSPAREDVFCLDVEWGGLEFDYTSQAKEWNTTTHEWETKAPANWALKSTSTDTITITNHSSCAVSVDFNFANDLSCPNVTGEFTKNDDTDLRTITSITNGINLSMDGANESEVDSFVVKFEPNGDIPSTHTENNSIGLITVTLKSDGN